MGVLSYLYLFTGKELDEETGLYYFGARYYDPRTSVWASVDPVLNEYLPNLSDLIEPEENQRTYNPEKELKGGGGIYNSMNIAVYAFSSLNPIIYIDPDGNTSCKNTACRIEEAKKVLQNPMPASVINKAKPSLGQGSGGFKSRTGGKHDGVDLQASAGSKIKAAGDGKADRGFLRGYGKTVRIDHGNSIETLYSHLEEYGVENNSKVEGGVDIGEVGTSGNVPKGADAHVHFEIKVDGEKIDPEKVFDWEHDK